jgi:hypothetical protein
MTATTIKLTTKAQAIRATMTEAPIPQSPPRADTYDADYNAKLFQETQILSEKHGLQTYLVVWGEVPMCIIVIRSTEKQATVWATTFVNNRRVMFKNVARGSGYDRHTAALAGLHIPSVHAHYGHDASPRHFALQDSGKRWYDQLVAEGFKVYRTL